MKIIITETQLKRSINELFAQKLVDQLIDKFQQEDPGLQPNIIEFYINRFQQIKDSPKVKNKDILTYSWNELKQIIYLNQTK
jgi:hypothetical protein